MRNVTTFTLLLVVVGVLIVLTAPIVSVAPIVTYVRGVRNHIDVSLVSARMVTAIKKVFRSCPCEGFVTVVGVRA